MKGIVMKASEFAARLIELVGICGGLEVAVDRSDVSVDRNDYELEPAAVEIQNCQTRQLSTAIGWVVRDEDNNTQVIKVY